jgi:hypothetical protein
MATFANTVRIESSHGVEWTVRLFLAKTCTHQVQATKSCARSKKIDDDEAFTLTMMRSASAFDGARCIVFLDTRPMNSVNTATSGTDLPSILRRTEQFRRFCGLDALLDRVGPTRSIVEIEVWAVDNVECRMVLTFLCWPRVALVVVVC